MCLSLTAHIITLWPRLSRLLCVCLSIPTLFCSLLANVYLICVSGALCIGFSTMSVCCALQLLCSTAVVLYSSPNNVFFLWCLQHSDLGWSVCLPTTLCCLLVCHCMFRAGRVDVNGGLEQVRRCCVVSVGRSVLWCPLVGAESDSCGRNGRWKGLIFRKIHFLTKQLLPVQNVVFNLRSGRSSLIVRAFASTPVLSVLLGAGSGACVPHVAPTTGLANPALLLAVTLRSRCFPSSALPSSSEFFKSHFLAAALARGNSRSPNA